MSMKTNHNDRKFRLYQVILSLSLAVFLISAAIPASVGHAEKLLKGEWLLPNHYPRGFHGYGHINRLEANEVVIDDNFFKLAPTVQYYIPDSEFGDRSAFGDGVLAGYFTNSAGEIVKLYLINPDGR